MSGGKFSNTLGKFSNLLTFIVNLCEGIGALLLAWSVYQLIIAFKDEAVEPKIKAVTILAVAVLLLSTKVWMNELLVGTGVTI